MKSEWLDEENRGLIGSVELAPLRPARHRMGKTYVEAYFKHFPVSDPVEDQDDRNALYCL